MKTGKVILAGAGPGDADLITVKLQKALSQADVILADRLVNSLIISENRRTDAEVVITGKKGYDAASFSQEQINSLIVSKALEGKNVVRLKGGDAAIFSNVLDELISVVEHAIPFEIIPGITAASGASAYAGIPLTARGHAQAVQFLTYNTTSYYSSEKWRSLAQSTDTLVFYMTTKNINDLVELLLRFSKRPLTPIAVIEQATTQHQQVHLSTLKNCMKDFAGKNFGSPSLIVVGDVVRLHERFNWFESKGEGSVFKELESKTI